MVEPRAIIKSSFKECQTTKKRNWQFIYKHATNVQAFQHSTIFTNEAQHKNSNTEFKFVMFVIKGVYRFMLAGLVSRESDTRYYCRNALLLSLYQ